jgi:peptidoglycan/xylan/chitin deacetylase (PgdA/CDA1 family)
MLNFRNTNIFVIVLLGVLIGIHIRMGLPLIVYPVIVIIYSLIVFYGCTYINAGFFLKIPCSANTNEKVIAISFDDGPDQNYTPQILQVLKEHEVKAAFFCIGKNINGNEAILKQVDAQGHIIGNHSYSHHFWFDMYSSKKMLADMKMMDNAVVATINKTPKLFRPPYGVTNPNLKKAILAGNYVPVGWSLRSMDTVAKDEKRLLDKVIAGLRPGAVFLFHDTCQVTLNILPAFIKEVKSRGYNISRLDKMLNLPAYA